MIAGRYALLLSLVTLMAMLLGAGDAEAKFPDAEARFENGSCSPLANSQHHDGQHTWTEASVSACKLNGVYYFSTYGHNSGFYGSWYGYRTVTQQSACSNCDYPPWSETETYIGAYYDATYYPYLDSVAFATVR